MEKLHQLKMNLKAQTSELNRQNRNVSNESIL